MDRQLEVLIRDGLARADRSDWEGSCGALRRAAALDAGRSDARFLLGRTIWLWAESRKPTLGDLSVGYLAKLAGFTGVAKQRSDRFAAHRRMLREAAQWLRDALEHNPDHLQARALLAQVLYGLGHHEQARDEIAIALRSAPGDARLAEIASGMSAGGESPADQVRAPRRSLTWDDVILPDRAKRELRQVQRMLEDPAGAMALGVTPPAGVLLTGPPGTGKTTVARVLADEARCRFYDLAPSDINRMYVGESERRVRAAFCEARAAAPSIVFLDEVDALLPERQGGVAIHSDKVVNQFLQEMDGMTPNDRVLVLGATNRPDMLDPAVRRGGRFSREIEIPLPGLPERRALLALFTKGASLAPEVSVERIAELTDGLAGADLRALVNEAGLQALVRLADDGADQPRAISPGDFDLAIENLMHAEGTGQTGTQEV